MVTFRERVKEARIAAGMSQAELAAKVHIDQAVIWRLESGRYKPNPQLNNLLWEALLKDAADIETLPIGKRIRIARIKRGLTQPELAEMVGISERGIWRIENRESPPWRTTIEKIGRVLPEILGGETVEQGQNGA